jgi:hypothetical protein
MFCCRRLLNFSVRRGIAEQAPDRLTSEIFSAVGLFRFVREAGKLRGEFFQRFAERSYYRGQFVVGFE